MQKQAPQMKESTKLESQASIMLGPQVIMDRPANIFSIWHTKAGGEKSGEVTSVDMSGNIFIGLDFSFFSRFLSVTAVLMICWLAHNWLEFRKFDGI